jgi:hypothetical protein
MPRRTMIYLLCFPIWRREVGAVATFIFGKQGG